MWCALHDCFGTRPPVVPAQSPMAPHLSPGELDLITTLVAKKYSAADILTKIKKLRQREKVEPPKIWAVRRAMAGVTHRRGRPEKRGRRRKLSPAQSDRMFKKRSELIAQADGERYVTVEEITRRARVPSVHVSTAGRYLAQHDVKWRRMREKPPRTEAHEECRKEVCRKWRQKPSTFWTEVVDLIIDAKKFSVPGSVAAAKRVRQQKVRGAMRTRQEGLLKGFTKPNIVKHKFNPGGSVSILAGICGDKIVLWEEIAGRWCGDKAAEMYSGPIKKVLQRRRPGKRSWLIMEDNDPAGFKSSKCKQAKGANHMRTMTQPPYSPDLNPLDFSIWAAIDKKALSGHTARESVAAYKARLRRTALGMPRAEVRMAVEGIKKRAHAIFAANGGNIRRD